MPCAETATLLFPVDGAVHRVGPDETAFAYRDASFATGLGPSWPDPADDEPNIAWGRAYAPALRPRQPVPAQPERPPASLPAGAPTR